jgi:hypothetical protein
MLWELPRPTAVALRAVSLKMTPDFKTIFHSTSKKDLALISFFFANFKNFNTFVSALTFSVKSPLHNTQ